MSTNGLLYVWENCKRNNSLFRDGKSSTRLSSFFSARKIFALDVLALLSLSIFACNFLINVLSRLNSTTSSLEKVVRNVLTPKSPPHALLVTGSALISASIGTM